MKGLTSTVGARGKHAIRKVGGVRAGGKKRRRVWTAACRAKALTTKVSSDCSVDTWERLETDVRRKLTCFQKRL